jgi:hypothetical protein
MCHRLDLGFLGFNRRRDSRPSTLVDVSGHSFVLTRLNGDQDFVAFLVKRIDGTIQKVEDEANLVRVISNPDLFQQLMIATHDGP